MLTHSLLVNCRVYLHSFTNNELEIFNTAQGRVLSALTCYYLHEFTSNGQEISIPHEAADCRIENLEFIVSERVHVSPDNSRAMSALTFLLFKLNTLQKNLIKV